MNWLHGWEFSPWEMFAITGNIAFASRFFVQWIASERAGRTVIPMLFWWLSIIGTIILLIYFVHMKNIPGVLGFMFNLIPYIRNIMLTKQHDRAVAAAAPPQAPA
jgi:lipid-A-disaccharide synthase-like uncharacterized protein